MSETILDDPRLAALPEDLRWRAIGFLDLHQAWDTDFDVQFRDGYGLEIGWRDGDTEALAQQHPAGNWTLWFGILGNCFSSEAKTRVKFKYQFPKLAKSADFAEFVQRFRRRKPWTIEEGLAWAVAQVLRSVRETNPQSFTALDIEDGLEKWVRSLSQQEARLMALLAVSPQGSNAVFGKSLGVSSSRVRQIFVSARRKLNRQWRCGRFFCRQGLAEVLEFIGERFPHLMPESLVQT